MMLTRSGPATARPRSFPDRRWSRITTEARNAVLTCPPVRSGSSAPIALYGTSRTWMAVVDFRSSPTICVMAPVPPDA